MFWDLAKAHCKLNASDRTVVMLMTLTHLRLPSPVLKFFYQLLLVLGLMFLSVLVGNHHRAVELGYMRNRGADDTNVSGVQSKTTTFSAFLVSI